MQNSYSLLDRGAEREMFPLCASAGVGFTAFSPLAGGWLTGKYRSAESYPAGSRMTLRPEPYRRLESTTVFQGLDGLKQAAERRNVNMSSLATAWALKQRPVDAVIIGPRTAAHLDQALAALDIALDDHASGELAALFPVT